MANNNNTLLELLDKYRIEVPIVQRDYAQGRTDERTDRVRRNLLGDMKKAIESGDALDLNYVYGKAQGDKFIPIDGQQRLTTLFLLHLYAFRDDNAKTDLLNKFTYETRISSREFLEGLVKHRAEIFHDDIPSDTITDAAWFRDGWEFDPTVSSALNMLDSIQKTFRDVDDLAAKLSDSTNEPLVFNFLEMTELGMEDSLYIKLNARGKALTDFENFKAQLTDRLTKLNLNLDFLRAFEQNLDANWTYLFWDAVKGDVKIFDNRFLLFFDTYFKNAGLLDGSSEKSEYLSVSQLDFNKIEPEHFTVIYNTLNYLYDKKESIAYNIVMNVLIHELPEEKKDVTHTNSVLFYAVTVFLADSAITDESIFEDWLRIMKNLSLNTRIDEPELRRKAIKSITALASSKADILDYFANDRNVDFFNGGQVSEEQIKAKLILSEDKDLAEIIFAAEQHQYFSGQIRSALLLAGYYDGDGDREKLSDYWEKIASLFDDSKPKYGKLMRQALLTFGDYRIKTGRSYAYESLYVDTPSVAPKSPTMKQLFAEKKDEVRQLLDALNTYDDVEQQLKRIVDSATFLQTDWQYCFLKYPAIFDRMSVSHMRMFSANDEILLIPNSDSSQYNTNVFLAALAAELWRRKVKRDFGGKWGQDNGRFLCVGDRIIRHANDVFLVYSKEGSLVFTSKINEPITETANWLSSNHGG
ncbi:hypothetical protein AGMMS49521_0420 [Campylobacterota bacterium]|nr:hypothetical protein AGMMS49521_0420 [Campylobacterota bacterium]